MSEFDKPKTLEEFTSNLWRDEALQLRAKVKELEAKVKKLESALVDIVNWLDCPMNEKEDRLVDILMQIDDIYVILGVDQSNE